MIARFTIALLLSFLALTGPPAHMRYRLSSHHASVWTAMYAKVPGRWKARKDVTVRELYPDSMDAFVMAEMGKLPPTGMVVDGLYDSATRSITMAESLDQDYAARVFLHEYGHYVWCDLLTSRERHDYERIWRAHQSLSISEYSLTNSAEGWAEDFSSFLYDPQELKDIDPSLFEFLSDVRDGRR